MRSARSPKLATQNPARRRKRKSRPSRMSGPALRPTLETRDGTGPAPYERNVRADAPLLLSLRVSCGLLPQETWRSHRSAATGVHERRSSSAITLLQLPIEFIDLALDRDNLRLRYRHGPRMK